MALRALQGPTGGGAPVGGTGTTNYIPRWNPGPSTLGDSGITDNGTTVSFVGRNLSSTAAQTWTLASSTSALNIASGLWNLDTSTSTLTTNGTAIYRASFDTTTTFTMGVADATVNANITAKRGSLLVQASSGVAGANQMGGGDLTLRAGNSYAGSATGTDGGVSIVAGYNLINAANSRAGITFTTANTQRAIIDYLGNVGIGTASPGAILHTLGTGTTTGIFATSSANAWVELRRSTSTTLGYIGTGSGLVTGGAAADLAFRCESGNLLFSTVATERARIDSSGRLGIGQTPTTYILETATDASFYGVRVGRGAGAVSSNTAVGGSALNANTTGANNVAVGYLALQTNSTAVSNTAVGFQAATSLSTGGRNTAVGESALYIAGTSVDNVAVGRYAAVYSTGSNNVAVGSAALNGVNGSSSGGSNVAVGASALTASTTGAGNTALGVSSGSTITTGSNNILLGANAITVAATDSNKLVIGSSGNYVATNGGATTWYTTATAQSTGVLPVTCGFIRVLLNGTYVKIPVYAD